ncbi:MAG: hypothetical protein AVDCRST_MAG56-2817, partial [uncultured Cytophagales bacterium]
CQPSRSNSSGLPCKEPPRRPAWNPLPKPSGTTARATGKKPTTLRRRRIRRRTASCTPTSTARKATPPMPATGTTAPAPPCPKLPSSKSGKAWSGSGC